MGGKKKVQGGEEEVLRKLPRWQKDFRTAEKLDKTKKWDREVLKSEHGLAHYPAKAFAARWPEDKESTHTEYYYRFCLVYPTLGDLDADQHTDLVHTIYDVITDDRKKYVKEDGTIRFWGLIAKEVTKREPRFARPGYVIEGVYNNSGDIGDVAAAELDAEDLVRKPLAERNARRAATPEKKKKKKRVSSSSSSSSSSAAAAAATPAPKKSKKRVLSSSDDDDDEVVEVKPSSSSSSSSAAAPKKRVKILATTSEEIKVAVGLMNQEEFEEYMRNAEAKVREEEEIAKKRALLRAAKAEADKQRKLQEERYNALLAITGGNVSVLAKVSPTKKTKLTTTSLPVPVVETTPVPVVVVEEKNNTPTIPPTQVVVEEEDKKEEETTIPPTQVVEEQENPTTPKQDVYPSSPDIFNQDDPYAFLNSPLSPMGKTTTTGATTQKVEMDEEIKETLVSVAAKSEMSWGYDPVGLVHGKLVEITDPYACPHEKCGHVRNHQAWVGRSRHVKDTLKCGMCNLDVKAKKLIKVMETPEQYFSTKSAAFRSFYVKDE